MEFKIYFHTNYSSSGIGSYAKVSVEMVGHGMFCAIQNKSTKALQCQRYKFDSCNILPDRRNYIGVTANGYYNGIQSLKDAWNTISQNDKMHLLDCVNKLPKSFRRYLLLEPVNENEVYAYIRGIKDMVLAMVQGRAVPASAPVEESGSNSVGAEWMPVGISSMTTADLGAIIELINTEHNPDDGVEFNGAMYRIITDENGKMVLHTRGVSTKVKKEAAGNNPFADAAAKPAAKPRHMSTMALMKDDDGMTEFVRGCYYRIASEFDGNHVLLVNDNGESRAVARKRLEMVKVYDEPPAAAVAD